MAQLIMITGLGYLLGRFLANRTSVSSATLTMALFIVGVAGVAHCLPLAILVAPLVAIRLGFGHAMRP